MSLKDTTNTLLSSLSEKGKEVATHTITEVKSSSKTIKILLGVCIAAIIGLSAICYNLNSRTVELEVLKTENIQIKNRMNDIENKIVQNHFEYLDLVNKVDNIDKDLNVKLEKAKEVIVHEVKTSNDISSVLNDLSDLSTGK